MSVANCRISRRLKGLPIRAFAAVNPATMAVAELPRPRESGTRFSMWMTAPRYSLSLPAFSKRYCADRQTMLRLSHGMFVAPSPVIVMDRPGSRVRRSSRSL